MDLETKLRSENYECYQPMQLQEMDMKSNLKDVEPPMDFGVPNSSHQSNNIFLQDLLHIDPFQANGASKVRKKSSAVKGQWTVEEDRLLIQLVGQYGVRKWSHIAQSLPGRIGKQCRERWHNHLRPDIKVPDFCFDEDENLSLFQEGTCNIETLLDDMPCAPPTMNEADFGEKLHFYGNVNNQFESEKSLEVQVKKEMDLVEMMSQVNEAL
ncbi:transcription factor MYB98-like [Senna tora]|uniref:Transcription factor MYB98-like n=1 Tax=Senna tora TaxID=362788 RepID=A0A835CED0_9FABA|nr:transcription factor MYB98-like [Senna tora]